MKVPVLYDNKDVVTMTSLELVDFINAERKERAHAAGASFPSKGHAQLDHADLVDKAPKVLGEAAPNFLGTAFYVNGTGAQVSRRIYRFPKREACLMAMSYSYELQAKVFDRMTALEARQPAPAELSRLDILSIALEAEKGRLLAVEERDHAIKTKAWIGDKKVATAMATASAKSRECAALRAQLGFNAQHATIKAVQAATGKPYAWQPLRRWCDALNQSPKNVTDPLYGVVKAWPGGAWVAVYGVDLAELFGGVLA